MWWNLPEATKTLIYKIYSNAYIRSFCLNKGNKILQRLRRGLKNNKEVEKELEESNTKILWKEWVMDFRYRSWSKKNWKKV